MIIMPNIDQHIWNLEFLTVDIVQEFQKNGKVVIDLNHEGPDANELGLYTILDYITKKFNIDKKLICIQTCNLLENHMDYQIIKRNPLYVPEVQEFISHHNYTKKDFYQIKHFGLFIGRSNWQRFWISAEIFGQYRDKTLQTFLYDPINDFHKDHLGFDRLYTETRAQCNLSFMSQLLSQSPVRIDFVDKFPIVTPAHFEISKHYHKFLIEIVCETYTAGQSFYPTEKIWRPIACQTPFMIQGPVNFLQNLHKLGFKTFHQWWDESYDEDGGLLGIRTILRNIERLSKMSAAELESMYDNMKPVLEHNYNVLIGLNSKSFEIFYDQ
jgi:hypothetical protein